MVQKIVFITAGTTFSVPSDYTTGDNTWHCIGAGGGGASGGGAGGGSGGAGAYAAIVNWAGVSADDTADVQLGAFGAGGIVTVCLCPGASGLDEPPAGMAVPAKGVRRYNRKRP